MGRCPLLIVLILQIAIILIADEVGLRQPQQPPSFGKNEYTAIVKTTREASTSGQLLIAEIDSVGCDKVRPFMSRLHFVGETPQLWPGQRIKFSSGLKPLLPVPAVPDILDLQSNLRRIGVTAVATIAEDSIKYIASANHLKEWFAKANEALLVRLKRTPLQPQTVDVLSAMLLGRGEMLPDKTRADYSAAGMSHVLALSGLHVGIIAIMVAFALWPFYFGRHVRTRLVLTISALWFYAAITAFIPSVTRSVIMATVYMAGRILQRKSSALNSLCLAAILILLVTPEDIYSVGFQLSFSAVLGIILFYPLINRVNRRQYPKLYNLVSYPALSISAMSFAGIVSAYHFHLFPLYFLVANLIIVPIVPLLIFSGVLSMIFQSNFGADYLCGAMDWISETISKLPMSTFGNLYPPEWLIFVLLVLLLLLACGVHGRHKFVAAESLLIFTTIIICCIVMPRTEYPDSEKYTVVENRSIQTIVATQDSCFIYTTAKLPAEREEIEARYQLLLRDFAGKRNLPLPKLK